MGILSPGNLRSPRSHLSHLCLLQLLQLPMSHREHSYASWRRDPAGGGTSTPGVSSSATRPKAFFSTTASWPSRKVKSRASFWGLWLSRWLGEVELGKRRRQVQENPHGLTR